MDCPFVVGQDVICIKRGPWVNALGDPATDGYLPKYGDRCKIAWISVFGDGAYLHFVSDPDEYRSFHHVEFRPIVERKTDISIFTQMLNVKELVD